MLQQSLIDALVEETSHIYYCKPESRITNPSYPKNCSTGKNESEVSKLRKEWHPRKYEVLGQNLGEII
jgi:hypothetical protein